MVVHFCWLGAYDRKQFCFRIFHNALWVEIWEGTLCKLVGVHDCLIFSEYPRHSATEGEKKQPFPLYNSLLHQYLHWNLCVLERLIS